MKKKNYDKRLRNHAIFFVITTVLFFGMITLMLVRINVYDDHRSIWPILAIVSMVLWFVNSYIGCRYLYLSDKANKGRVRANRSDKSRKDIRTYVLENIIDNDIKETFHQMLPEFNVQENDLGVVYYCQKKFFTNKEVNIYCILKPAQNIMNDFMTEPENIKTYSNKIATFIGNTGMSSAFLNCVFVVPFDVMKDEEKDFYYDFIGYWDCEMNKNRIVKNRFCNYCGIECSTGKIYFYQPSANDEGDEADLSSMILGDLDIKEIDV